MAPDLTSLDFVFKLLFFFPFFLSFDASTLLSQCVHIMYIRIVFNSM